MMKSNGLPNGDYIRSLDNDKLARFLWTWSINTLCSFLEKGGQELMHGEALRNWLDSEDFVCIQTRVGEELVYDQAFELKEDYE